MVWKRFTCKMAEDVGAVSEAHNEERLNKVKNFRLEIPGRDCCVSALVLIYILQVLCYLHICLQFPTIPEHVSHFYYYSQEVEIGEREQDDQIEIQAPKQGPKITYREKIVYVEKIVKEIVEKIVEVTIEIPLTLIHLYVYAFHIHTTLALP